MSRSLSPADIAVLSAYNSAGDRLGYFNYIGSLGDNYGMLAASVVTADTW
jgi:hypothetical protein